MSPRSIPKRGAILYGAAALGAAFLSASSAHAGDADCLWRRLSVASQEDAMSRMQASGIDGLRQWKPTPVEASQMAAICVTSGGDLRSASRALYDFLAETFLARSFSDRFGISGNLGDDLWSALPPAQRAEFRRAVMDHSQGKPRDGTEERILAATLNRPYFAMASRPPEQRAEIVKTIAAYCVFRARREADESRF